MLNSGNVARGIGRYLYEGVKSLWQATQEAQEAFSRLSSDIEAKACCSAPKKTCLFLADYVLETPKALFYLMVNWSEEYNFSTEDSRTCLVHLSLEGRKVEERLCQY